MTRAKVDPAVAREARLRAVLELMPAGLEADMQAEWSRLAGDLADDPPSWSPSPRYRDLLREFCAEACRIRQYRTALKTVNLEVYREKAPGGAERVKVHPYVPLLDQALKRWRELAELLELSPCSSRKRNLFDAA